MIFCVVVDDCPQKFLDGRDPYMKSTTVYVLSGKASLTLPNSLLLLLLSILSISTTHQLS